MPVPPIYSGPPLFSGPMIDMVQIVSAISADVVAVRASRGLPALVGAPAGYPTGSILVGQEWVRREHSPPRIVLVPTGIRLLPGRALGYQQTGAVSQLPTRPFIGASSDSTRTYGAIRIPLARTRFTTSTRRSSFSASSWAPATGFWAVRRNSSTENRAGSRTRTIADSAGCSSTPSRSRVTSRTSRTCCCPTARRAEAASRHSSLSKRYSRTARPQPSARSWPHHEVN